MFTGTERWYRYSPGLLVTDGVKFLIDNGAAWVVDIIASARTIRAVRDEEKEFWKLTVSDDHTAKIICTDGDKGNGPVTLFKQDIPFTDFPMKLLHLYVISDNKTKVIMLPSEY